MKMNDKANQIHCPIKGPYDFEPCDSKEVTPLVEFLESNQPVESPIEFPRGTMLPDGRLDLCKQDLGPDGCLRVAQAMSRNRHVKSLLLGTDGIGDEGARSVADLIRQNDSLQIVYLGCNSITAEGAASLSDALKENESVRGLWLKRNPIGDEGVMAIAELLKANSHLEVLDLVNTGIGKPGLAALLNVLERKDCGVRRLYLGGNNLDAADAVSIAKSLAKSGTIESLMLGVNFLGDAGAISIADLLPHCPALRELGLASNGIETSGTAALCSAIRRHPKLVYFDLGFAPSTKVLGAAGNVPGNDGFQSILKLVSTNSSLRRLNLRGICITDHDKEQLGVAMQSNTNLVSLIVDGRLPQAISDRLIQNLDQSPQCNDAPEEVRLIRSVYRTATKRARTVGFNTKES